MALITPGQSFWHPWKTSRNFNNLEIKNNELDGKNAKLSAEVAKLTKQVKAFTDGKNKIEAQRANAQKISSLVERLQDVFGNNDEMKITQALQNFQRTGDPLPVSLCTPDNMNKLFWDAVGKLYQDGKLALHGPENAQFGALIDGPILKKNYYMNTDVTTALVRGIANIAGKSAYGKISIHAQDSGKGAISLDFENMGKMDIGSIEIVQQAAELLGVKVEYGASNVKVWLPYQN
ncbi:MAG: hypothetical protein NT051_03450 [Candidatus Micrarchaeota archaeon]|nr:hypothetical protein [Candidatus Micrarchaeota archaeon]